MAGDATTNQGNIRAEYNVATTGMNMDNTVNQVPKGMLTYALNAAVENFDSNSVNYQNEPGNEFCLDFPVGYQLIGTHFIPEKNNKHIFFLANPDTGQSEIGYMDNNDCIYHTLINAVCLNFNIEHPIHKVVHKITNCTTEIYWTDGYNSRRYLDLENIPYKLTDTSTTCDPHYTQELDCNQLKLQPNFNIPEIEVKDVTTGGSLIAGTYQFSVQYSDAAGNPYTSYYSITNPTPIADIHLTTPNFNYEVGKSIVLNISNLDITGEFQYFNLAVIKTVNNIPAVELVGTYFITGSQMPITYTGQNQTQIRLTTSDIFEKYPYYDIAQDLTTVQDVLVWDNLTSIDRINYQGIANQISLYWQTYRLPAGENYADEINATNLRGYLRDEVYAFEIVFILRNGKQTDGFHIPGRAFLPSDVYPDVPTTNDDFIGEPDYTIGTVGYSKYWKIYNTATVLGNATGENIGNATPYQYGEFAYWESTELYPCNTDVWGDLANQPIRHHKFPDVLVSPIYESAYYSTGGPVSPVIQNDAIFPIGVKVDLFQIRSLINSSSLTQEQKEDIVAFKIVRGNRNTNKSIVAKGILRNVGKYDKEETTYYFPNYPYNDLRQDPFLLNKSNAFTANAALTSNTNDTCRNFTITAYEDSIYEYVDCFSQTLISKTIATGDVINFCAISLPVVTSGRCCMVSNTYTRWLIAGCKSCTQGFSYFDIIDAFGLYSTNTYPPGTPGGGGGPIHTCDFCRSNPSDAACVGGVYGTGQFNKYNAVVGSGLFDVTSFYVNSLIKPVYTGGDPFEGTITEVGKTGYDLCAPTNLEAFKTDDSKYRQVFNSPETSFAQPFLGDVLKLENVMFGAGEAHFVQVKKNAMYKLITIEAQQDALESSDHIAGITVGSYNPTALFAAYQAYLTIYINGITRRNYAYSYNSRASYDYSASIDNGLGIKQRPVELSQYLIPAVQAIGDNYNFNNYQRESSVYIKTSTSNTNSTTVTPLPFPDATPSMLYGSLPILSDHSRSVLSDYGCNKVLPEQIKPISVVSYYGSIKNIFVNQWGQMYSYETIDTGFQRNINPIINEADVVFGGDTFINRFAFKTKLPFFIDNRVGAPDDSDIFFDELGNVAYPEYWHSARSILTTGTVSGVDLTNFISIKAHNFDCPNSQASTLQGIPNAGRTFYDGKMYLFAYGIPNFYCESSYNMDLRQAFNNKEGDFWPHVSTGIPDDWVQESNVTIAQDNTYYYNVTFSKQNKENYFSHLPQDWKQQLCFTHYPFRAIYSDQADANADNRVNAWLSYGASSKFDFPQNFGKLTSLDGIQNKAVLARFENKSLLYNTLLTVETSNPQAAYLGNSTLFKSSPPIDFAETDLGYVGSQNKFLLKIPQGQITVDAKRGQVFLVAGNQASDLSAFGSGLNRFFTDHLAFEILRYFPEVDTDNHFNGIGLHGVYDSKYDRVIISKLDYIPQPGKNIIYDAITKEFYLVTDINNTQIKSKVYITDLEYFCNKSWTLSFNMNTKSWVSFHSYIPNWYIAENNFFYSGLNGSCDLTAIAFEEIP